MPWFSRRRQMRRNDISIAELGQKFEAHVSSNDAAHLVMAARLDREERKQDDRHEENKTALQEIRHALGDIHRRVDGLMAKALGWQGAAILLILAITGYLLTHGTPWAIK